MVNTKSFEEVLKNKFTVATLHAFITYLFMDSGDMSWRPFLCGLVCHLKS